MNEFATISLTKDELTYYALTYYNYVIAMNGGYMYAIEEYGAILDAYHNRFVDMEENVEI